MNLKDQNMTKQKKESQEPNTQANTAPSSPHTPSAAVTIDFEKYARHVEGLDLPEDRKQEFLAGMWLIACEFIAMGFRVHTTNLAEKACGKIPENTGEPPIRDENELCSLSQFIEKNYSEYSGLETARSEEGVTS